MSWHVESELLKRYQAGDIDWTSAASVEMHMTECVQCRSLLRVERDWLDRSWASIVERVEPGPRGIVERVLVGLRVPEGAARIVAVSPALRPSFALAVLLALAFALAVDRISGTGSGFFLLLAPLLPVAGVAAAYGPLADPAYDMALAAPLSALRVLLLRTMAVLSVALLASLAAWAVAPEVSSIGVVIWLLPAVALTLITLALASRFEVVPAALVSGVGWVASLLFAGDAAAARGGGRQLVLLALAFASGVTIWLSKERYQRRAE